MHKSVNREDKEMSTLIFLKTKKRLLPKIFAKISQKWPLEWFYIAL